MIDLGEAAVNGAGHLAGESRHAAYREVTSGRERARATTTAPGPREEGYGARSGR